MPMFWPRSFIPYVTAARAVRDAERGPAAYATVRPRGVTGLLRSRAPLPVMLYIADQEGRFVRPGISSFALLERPLTDPAIRGGGWRLRLARLADRHWELLLFAGPPILGLLGAVACIPFRGLWPAAIVFALAAMVYVFVLMTGMVVMAVIWLYQTFGRRTPHGSDAAESLPAYHWTLRLFHCPDAGREDRLAAEIAQRLRVLVTSRIRTIAAEISADVDVRVATPLVTLLRGSTTQTARAYLAASRRTAKPYGSSGDVVVFIPPDPPANRSPRFVSTAGFFFWYLFGMIVIFAICAYVVAIREAAACATDCASRPATYEDALRWLFGLAGELRPQTSGMWVMGMLAAIARWLTLPVLAVAVWQRWRLSKHDNAVFERTVASLQKPRVLIFVITQVEYDAVVAAAVAASPDLTTWLEPRRDHTVLRLGEIGGCDVALVRSGPGPYSSRGLLADTLDIVDDMQPDAIVLTGICFGLRDAEQEIGDVVVASQVRDLDHRKFAEKGKVVVEQPRGDRIGPTASLFHHAVGFGSEWTEPGPRIHVGPMGGSGTLYNSEHRRAEIIAANPDLLAADMECHVFGAAAVRRSTNWCVVRGISDRGREKRDEYQRIAAENAARLVFEVLTSGAVRR